MAVQHNFSYYRRGNEHGIETDSNNSFFTLIKVYRNILIVLHYTETMTQHIQYEHKFVELNYNRNSTFFFPLNYLDRGFCGLCHATDPLIGRVI